MKKTLLVLLAFVVMIPISFSQVNFTTGIAPNATPISISSNYSCSQTIFTANQINASGLIDSIRFYTNDATSLLNSTHWQVLLGHTYVADFESDDWVTVNTDDLYFDGTVSVVDNYITIVLEEPFEYNGEDNLVITVNELSAGSGADNTIFNSTSTTYAATKISTNTMPYDAYNLINSTWNDYTLDYYSNVSLYGITPICQNPTNLELDSVNVNLAHFSWSDSHSSYQIDIAEELIPFGEGNITSTATNSIVIDTLTVATYYRFYVRGVCLNDTSGWQGPYYFQTSCGLFSTDYYEDFTNDSEYSGDPPDCWTERQGSIDNPTNFEPYFNSIWWFNAQANIGGTQAGTSAQCGFPYQSRAWLLSPSVFLEDSLNYLLSYRAAITGGTNLADDDTVYVVISTDDGQTWSRNNIIRTYNSSNMNLSSSGDTISDDLSDYSGNIQIGFYASSETLQIPSVRFHIDDFSIKKVEGCLQPSSLAVSNVDETSVTLEWNVPDTNVTFNVEYGEAGFAQGSGQLINFLADNFVNIDNLQASTEYEFYVQTRCFSEFSEWAGPYLFSTLCSSYTAPTAVETFSLGFPDCWSKSVGELSLETEFSQLGTSGWSDVNSFFQITENMSVFVGIDQEWEWLISPSINLGTNGGDFDVKFDITAQQYYANTDLQIMPDDTLCLIISEDDGLSWSDTSVLAYWTADNLPDFGIVLSETIDVSNYTDRVKFAFYMQSTASNLDPYYIRVDNFVVAGTPTPNPEDTLDVELAQYDIEVYPNPNDGQFILELSEKPATQLKLRVSNVLGQIVHKQLIYSTTNTIDLNGIKGGIYIMDLSSPTQSFKTRIVIN